MSRLRKRFSLATMCRRTRPPSRSSTEESTRRKGNTSGWSGLSWKNWSSSIMTWDPGPDRSSNHWQANTASKDTFNATVLQAMRQPSRPTPTCGWSIAWRISVVILSMPWVKTKRKPNMDWAQIQYMYRIEHCCDKAGLSSDGRKAKRRN